METKPEPKFKVGDRVFNLASKKSVNIMEWDKETGLYIVRYDDGVRGRSLESELKRLEHITWDDVKDGTVANKWDEHSPRDVAERLTSFTNPKKEYPKTYEECAEIIAELTGSDCNPKGCMGYMSVQLTALQKLLICRDAYWHTYGEEFNWDNALYYIYTNDYGDVIESDDLDNHNHILGFPNAETRDAFRENFDSDIEICKELL